MIYNKMGLKKYSEFSKIVEGYLDIEDPEYGWDPEITPSIEPFEIVERAEGGLDCIFRAKSDNSLYFFAGESFLDSNKLEPYGNPPVRREYDEGRYVWVTDTSDWEPEAWVVEAYVNCNFSHLKYGEGVEDFESGDNEFILIDEPLKELLKKTYEFSKI
jgi:hypothetical protein